MRRFRAQSRSSISRSLVTGPWESLEPRRLLAATANDLFANAVVLTGENISATVDSTDATAEPGEPQHAGQPGGASVWWRWTAPATGNLKTTR